MKVLFTLVAVLSCICSLAQNPIAPPGMYIADPEARVWQDGKIYLYGSRDESNDYWCSYKHHVLSSDDLIHWDVTENSFASKGKNDQVNYHDRLLFAPDCMYKNGTYYLYYCSPKLHTEGVATSKYPMGPFINGQEIDGPKQIDPAAFIDDDGQAYYLWGQGKSKMAKLKDNMKEIDKSTITLPLDAAGNKAFHEASSIRKIKDWYYLVFADASRNHTPTCLGYAMSKKVMGPYTYKGIIIDNVGCDPSDWNNHGSIQNFHGKWYVFYHRSTHNSKVFRKACLEPIHINRDGTIDEVEMTSQGALPYLNANSRIQGEQACLLSGKTYIDELAYTDIPTEGLTHISNNDHAVYKYIRFKKQSHFRVKTTKTKGGNIEIHLDSPDGILLNTCHIKPATKNTAYSISECNVKKITGKHALYLVFKGNEKSMFNVDWFEFY